jgi:uncharacterized protein (UPF0332 family)
LNNETLIIRIRLEVDRAKESFKAAELLFNAELFDESVSSAYYAIFHMAKALLLTIEEEPSTHHGLITVFGLRFIKPKIIESKYNDILVGAKEARESGDYDAAREFNKEEAGEQLLNAKDFHGRILEYLHQKSFY